MNPPISEFFRVIARDSETGARLGRIETERGTVSTPAFMPIATEGAVKGVGIGDLREIGADILLGNAYHLYLRPGVDVIASLGGLSEFMGWGGPVLTDSGGFQAFSLGDRVELHPDGVRFRSHLDGSRHEWTPEKVVEVQAALGVDVAMPLDDCPPYPSERSRLEAAVERSRTWLERSIRGWRGSGVLFGIAQGGTDLELRRRSIEITSELDLPGVALGGLSVGEPRDLFRATAAASAAWLPVDRPRYVMGTGTPEDLIELVSLGYDLFDCVLPTRNGRNGTLFTRDGKLNIRNARFARDPAPPDSDCRCPVCTRYSRAYLRHLSMAGERLSATLNSVHNLSYYLGLVAEMRRALERGQFPEYRAQALTRLSAEAVVR